MVVFTEWPSAPWYPLFSEIIERSVLLSEPIYLDANGNLRPTPKWKTLIVIVNGEMPQLRQNGRFRM